MKNKLSYILILCLILITQSCGLEEPNTQHSDLSTFSIEFVARPTLYDQFNVSTKASASEIDALENNIYTAFFLLFDDEGNRVIFKDITTDATAEGAMGYTIDNQTIKPDICLSKATACFLANVPTDYAKSLKTLDDLKGNKPLQLTYASVTSGCIGIPVLTDTSKGINDRYSIPMAGILTCNLYDSNNSDIVQIPLERLFAKFIINLSVDLKNDSGKTPDPQKFTLSNFVINNMPTKLAIMRPDADQPTRWSDSSIESDYLQEDNILTYFNLDDGSDDSNIVATKNNSGEVKKLFFYAPEHIVYPDKENTASEEEQKQLYKPSLFESNSPKRPLYVSIIGDLIDENANDVVGKYDIYLGTNNFDDFRVIRNHQYNNNIIIKGTESSDYRVSLTQGYVSVSFKRATYLDSHFEVRPLRVKWVGKDLDGNTFPAEGTVTIKIMDPYDDQADVVPDWLRLERPSNPSGNDYCGNIGKRKYFTTNLVKSDGSLEGILADNTILTYNINDDPDGDFPTWIYVDEFITPNTDGTFSDAVRQAKIRVTYTPPADSEAEILDIDYVITQRSVYPVVATKQTNHTYGIEFFEEYLYDYDRVDVEDLGEGEYASTQDGMKWGLNGVQLSHIYKSVYLSEIKAQQQSGNILDNISNLDGINRIVRNIVNNTITDKGLPYYDFYLSRDQTVAEATQRDYSGITFNKEILNILNMLDDESESINLNISLGDKPESVIEYCYNKNKRDSKGNIGIVHWYVPAIDEIEDITVSAYNEFNVFQNKLYWSCQPSYNINNVILQDYNLVIETQNKTTYIDGTPEKNEKSESRVPFEGSGNYQTDNIYRARATKINAAGENVSSAIGPDDYTDQMNLSGEYRYYILYHHKQEKYSLPFIGEGYRINYDWIPETQEDPDPKSSHTINPTNKIINYDAYPGNVSREVKNRVRCVYHPDGVSL